MFGKVTMKGVNITWLVMNEDVVSLFKSTWALSLCSIIGNNIALLVSGYRVSQENLTLYVMRFFKSTHRLQDNGWDSHV